MYKAYQSDGSYGCGQFTAKLDRCDSITVANAYKKVGNYQLLYKKTNSAGQLSSEYMNK